MKYNIENLTHSPYTIILANNRSFVLAAEEKKEGVEISQYFLAHYKRCGFLKVEDHQEDDNNPVEPVELVASSVSSDENNDDSGAQATNSEDGENKDAVAENDAQEPIDNVTAGDNQEPDTEPQASIEPEGLQVKEEKSLESMDIEELKKQYEVVLGKKPHHKFSREKIIALINEKANENG